MRIIRVYLANITLQPDQLVVLDKSIQHRLFRVMRLKPGMTIHVFDGSGHEFLARIVDQKTISVLEPLVSQTESPLHTRLLLGLSRGERMDWAMQKATEMGVSQIQPVITRYCEVKLDDNRLRKRMDHWQGILISACEQSGRTRLPELQPVIALHAALQGSLSDSSGQCRLILDPDGASRVQDISLNRSNSVTLLTGPEGGFSEEEVEAAYQHGFQGIRMGPRILRAETAPIAALAIIQARIGDI
ncbi:MAG: 16S rRNA (uracil(1498)-N(3))-methyltransferase [Gammaproteobacteria bacterium]|nr:MAG: 16S rRNA (uracil(1498)-N(3))-methyltransferase [Gammaproteobacteria bacterium]